MNKALNRTFKKRVSNPLEHIVQTFAPFRDQIKGFLVESTDNGYWRVVGLMDAVFTFAQSLCKVLLLRT